MCRAAVIDILIGLPPPACCAAEHSLERSAAAACAAPPFYLLSTICRRRFVPRRRLPNCTVCRQRSVPRRRLSYCTVCRRRCAAQSSAIVTGLSPLCRSCFVVPPRRAHCLLFWCCRCCCYCLVFVITAAWPRSSVEIHGIDPAAYR